jgi:hypothetical protein
MNFPEAARSSVGFARWSGVLEEDLACAWIAEHLCRLVAAKFAMDELSVSPGQPDALLQRALTPSSNIRTAHARRRTARSNRFVHIRWGC